MLYYKHTYMLHVPTTTDHASKSKENVVRFRVIYTNCFHIYMWCL